MAGRRILAARYLLRRPEEAAGPAGRRLAARDRRRRAEAEADHVGQVERPAAQPGPLAAAFGAGCRDMAERIRALVAESGGMVGTGDAEGIQDEQESARHEARPGGFAAMMGAIWVKACGGKCRRLRRGQLPRGMLWMPIGRCAAER